MKKIFAILMLCVLTVSMMALPSLSVSAATPKEQLVACARENMPQAMIDRYLPAIENTLRLINVTQEQADQVCAIIVETREYFDSTGGFKGVSLHDYTVAQQQYSLDVVSKICEILGLNARYTISTDSDHDFDFVCTIYGSNGRRLAILDGDSVKQTNTPYTVNYNYLFAAVALLVGAAAIAVVGKKFAAQN